MSYSRVPLLDLENRIQTLGRKIEEVFSDVRQLHVKQPDYGAQVEDIPVRIHSLVEEVSRLQQVIKGDLIKHNQIVKMADSLRTVTRALDEKILKFSQTPQRNRQFGHSDEEERVERENTQSNAILAQQAEYNTQILHQRENQIKEIFTELVAIRQLSNDMNVMLQDQTKSLEQAESNTAAAVQNTTAAVGELHTADKHDRKSRNWLCCLLLVVVIVVAVVGVVVGVVVVANRK